LAGVTATTPRGLLGAAIPAPSAARFRPEELAALAALQDVLDADIAPAAARADAAGRYPTASIAALKRSGILQSGLPAEWGGLGASHRVSLEAQVRIAAADSSVAQIFKVHDELTREIFVYCPDELRPPLSARIRDGAILGLAVAESGRKVDDPWRTVATPHADGGFTVDGEKIYTTGAAEADLIAVWAFNPAAEGAADNFLLGLQLNLVPRDTEGVTVHRDWDMLGQRATDSGTVTFRQVRTDPALRASVPGRAPLPQNSLRYQAGFAAVLVGIGIGAMSAAVPFVASRARPWPSAGVDSAADDPVVKRLAGELTAGLAAAYALTMATGDLLDAFERGELSRTELAVPIFTAKSAATKAALAATADAFALMGASATRTGTGFDRYWRDARTLALHDPVDWKHIEIGANVLSAWDPPPGIYT
jgi:alkylation response protein AidB-like acyl-CoA dehydrogenase